MKTKAVRLYGKADLRLEAFELPPMRDDEIFARVMTDSLCMSSYKAVHQGEDHKRVPRGIASNPVIIGHEFSGEILEVGGKWRHKFKPGDKFSIQPAMCYPYGPAGLMSAPGYSYPYAGGDATYIIIPNEVMEMDCLLVYRGPGFFPASLAEPLSCVIGAMHACYHVSPGTYRHDMEIRDGGKMALLAGVGPMGLACINCVLHREDRRPALFVVTDINQERLDRAAQLYSVEFAASRGIELHYLNTSGVEDPAAALRELSGGTGYDEVVVMASVPMPELLLRTRRGAFQSALQFLQRALCFYTCGGHQRRQYGRHERGSGHHGTRPRSGRHGDPCGRPQFGDRHHPQPALNSRREEADLHPCKHAADSHCRLRKSGEAGI